MHFLIHLVGRWLAGHMERGSRFGSVIGALIGASVGAAAGVVLWKTGLAGFLGPAIIVTLGCAAAFIGGILGGRFGPIADMSRGITAEPTGHAPERVMNLNAALGPLAICVIFLALTIVLICLRLQEREPLSSLSWEELLGPAGGLVFLGMFLRSVLWIDVQSEHIVVRRALTRKVYQRDQVTGWGFVSALGVSTDPPSVGARWVIKFADGFQFEAKVSPQAARRIAGAFDVVYDRDASAEAEA